MKLVTDDGIEIGEVKRVSLKPDDIIVIHVTERGCKPSLAMCELWRKVFYENSLVIMSYGQQLGIVGKEDIPELKPLKYEIDDDREVKVIPEAKFVDISVDKKVKDED